MNKIFLAALFCCGYALAANPAKPTEPPSPTMQSHTQHPEIFANATLQASAGAKITGNVEILEEPNSKVLVTLANGEAAEKLTVSLIDSETCPNGEASSGRKGTGKEILRLSDVTITDAGVGTAERKVRQIKTKADRKNYLMRAVVVQKSPFKKDQPYLACGILQPTNPPQQNR